MATQKQPEESTPNWFEDAAPVDDPFQALQLNLNTQHQSPSPSADGVTAPATPPTTAVVAAAKSPVEPEALTKDSASPSATEGSGKNAHDPTSIPAVKSPVAGDASALFAGDDSSSHLFFASAGDAAPGANDFFSQPHQPSQPAQPAHSGEPDQFFEQLGQQHTAPGMSAGQAYAYDASATNQSYDPSNHPAGDVSGQYHQYQNTGYDQQYNHPSPSQYDYSNYSNYQYADQQDSYTANYYAPHQATTQYAHQPDAQYDQSYGQYDQSGYYQTTDQQQYVQQYGTGAEYHPSQYDPAGYNASGAYQEQKEYQTGVSEQQHDPYAEYGGVYQPENYQYQQTGVYDPYAPPSQAQAGAQSQVTGQQTQYNQSHENAYTPQPPFDETSQQHTANQQYDYGQAYTPQSVNHQDYHQGYAPQAVAQEDVYNQQPYTPQSINYHYHPEHKDAYTPQASQQPHDNHGPPPKDSTFDQQLQQPPVLTKEKASESQHQNGYTSQVQDQVVPQNVPSSQFNGSNQFHYEFDEAEASDYQYYPHQTANGAGVQPHETSYDQPFDLQAAAAENLQEVDQGKNVDFQVFDNLASEFQPLETHDVPLTNVHSSNEYEAPTLQIEEQEEQETKQEDVHYEQQQETTDEKVNYYGNYDLDFAGQVDQEQYVPFDTSAQGQGEPQQDNAGTDLPKPEQQQSQQPDQIANLSSSYDTGAEHVTMQAVSVEGAENQESDSKNFSDKSREMSEVDLGAVSQQKGSEHDNLQEQAVPAFTQSYDPKAYDPQAYDPQAYEPQTHDTHAYDSQAYDPQTYNSQANDHQAYDSQTYNPQEYSYQTYDPQAYNSQTHGSQAHDSQAYDPQTYSHEQASSYQPYTGTHVPEPAAAVAEEPTVYAPGRPQSAAEGSQAPFAGYNASYPYIARSSTLPPMNGKLSPFQSDSLVPCPDPNCEGENKAKAKFCCECGRPLASLSRSTTPAGNVSAPAFDTHLSSINTYGAALHHVAPAADMYAPDQSYVSEPATHNVQGQEMGEAAYYATEPATEEMYEPTAHAEMPATDPLNRSSGCPLISFGFGGKLCLMFPQKVQRFTNHGGYDAGAPIIKTMPSVIQIKRLKDVLGEQDPMVEGLSEFIGPVLLDSKTGVKAKKKEAIAYIDKRVAKLSSEPDFTASHSLQQRALLFKLIKVLIENEGTIGDGDKMDTAVRTLIQPPVETESEDQGNFSVPAYAQALQAENANDDQDDEERSKTILDKLQSYLLKGDRAAAVDYAIQQDLWTHALIISSCVNKELWMTVVTNFVNRQLSGSAADILRQARIPVMGDRQALRVLYCLFAGSGGNSISEFLQNPEHRLGRPFGMTGTTTTDNEKLSQWQVTLTLILANRTARDSEAITGLGDLLRAHGWIDAAHICYLLSPQTSIHSGLDAAHVRLTLIGADGPSAYNNLDAYFLTELYEFAIATKQGEPASLPFLQGFKLVHAWWLADLGYLAEAQRYCEAIANATKAYSKGSPYLHRQLLESVKEFSELCEISSGQSLGSDAGSWLKTKLSKGSLDSLWGSLEGKFNKFVSGDDMTSTEPEVRKSTEIMGTPYEGVLEGPPARSASAFDFRNSGRSSAVLETVRRAVTPTASMVNEVYGSQRAASPGRHAAGTLAHAFTPMTNTPSQDRLAHHSQAREAQHTYGYGAQPTNATVSPFKTGPAQTMYTPDQTQPSYGGGWYDQYSQPAVGTAQNETESTTQSPYHPQTDYGAQHDYDAQPDYGSQSAYGNETTVYGATQQTTQQSYLDDDDDLGFGNSSLRKSKPAVDHQGDKAPEVNTPSEADDSKDTKDSSDDKDKKPESKSGGGGGGGWFKSLFSRSATPSEEKKAVKANLGEENSFYYDEVEKRWVNKAAGATPPPAPSLPPPPKTSTASQPSANAASSRLAPPPSFAAPPKSSSGTPATPPLATNSAPPGQMAPPPGPSSKAVPSPTPPLSTATTPPPSSGARRAGRKPMRSRYVDVFNQ